MRKFYFKYIGEAYVLYRGQQPNEIVPKIEVRIEVLPLQSLSKKAVQAIISLEGYLSFLYLRLAYGSPETYLALVWVGEKLAGIEWAIPYKKCRRRSFIPEKAYMLAAGYTAPPFRGNRIHPFMLQEIGRRIPGCDEYWMLVHENNVPSIKGVEKVGRHVGRFVQKRWLWGCLRSTKYYPDAS